MKNKIIIWTLIWVSILATSVASAHMWWWSWKFDKILTSEEKAQIQNMTTEQKQDFIKTKITEMKAKRLAHETVIDKLLNWETLTDDEKKLLEEIKANRAEMKAKFSEMKWSFGKWNKKRWMMKWDCSMIK